MKEKQRQMEERRTGEKNRKELKKKKRRTGKEGEKEF
jgi:hypothetical protein